MHLGILVLLATSCPAEVPPAVAPAATVAERPNFVIRGPLSPAQLQTLHGQCEALRAQLQQRWFGRSAPPWAPPCQVVVHATRSSYLRSVGAGGGNSLGSSLVRGGSSGIASRRVDLLQDAAGRLPALAHEVAHVVLADYFQGSPPPRWADEGIAMLSDPESKRALHRRDCQQALRSGRDLRLIELMTLVELTEAGQVPAFYGQSLTLVEFLAQHYEPQRLLPFLDAARTGGYDQALQTHYGLAGVDQLERLWRQHLLATQVAVR